MSLQDTRGAARLPTPDGVIPYAMVLLFIVAMYGVVSHTVPTLRPFRPAMTLAVGALVLLVIERTLSGRAFRISWPEGHAFIAFFGAVVLSAFNALWPGLAVENAMNFTKLLVLYLLIVNVVSTRARLRGLLWTMVLAGMIPARGTISFYLAGNLSEGDRAAWIGTFSNPNQVAFELSILVPLALALLITANIWGRLILAGVLGTFLVAIFLTYSRSGLLGLGVMVVVGIFRLRSVVVRVVVAVCVLAAVAVGLQFWERDEGFDNLDNDVTLNSRMDSIEGGLAMFQDNPVFGVGIGCSILGWAVYSPNSRGHVISIHNTYVQALAETGGVGFTLFMLMILVTLWRMHTLGAATRSSDPEMSAYATATELSIVAFMVAGAANGFVFIPAPYLLIALASATKCVAMAEQQPEAI